MSASLLNDTQSIGYVAAEQPQTFIFGATMSCQIAKDADSVATRLSRSDDESNRLNRRGWEQEGMETAEK